MTIFNSLGSNYNFRFVLKALAPRSGHHHLKLRESLETRYGGETILFHKGREALELALRIIQNAPRSGHHHLKLRESLETRYGGETILFHKGREALELALRIIQKIDNLPSGSLVAINGFTCYAVYQAVANAGYTPFYLDIEENSLNFSPAKLRSTLETNPGIKVVVVQNTLGYPCAVEEIAQICAEKGIILIEDLAHSVGAVYGSGKEAGAFGDFTVFSFSQDKIIDGISGGALVIKNPRYRIRAPYPLNDLDYKTQLIERLYPLF
ncbi:MAG: aminotransferase class I/II-fold pyridoxal phosphate-dependent enzyme, partial [Candidatus Colwellbacteria bacterium]|nr:aminotransferase class I/II-fold pyridoxal phosphate-dependent enzyme [Candidatus Colwellbacteria bacterium]